MGFNDRLTPGASSAAPSPADGQSHGTSTVGEPDAQTTPQWCKKCQADVIPRGKGLCPRCGIFLKQNFVARRHPVNVLRRDALKAELFAEFRPGNIIDRSNCEHLAATMEQLDTMRPGSSEWQRLVTVKQTLVAALHNARPSHKPTNFDDMSAAELADHAEQVARHLRDIADREAAHLC